MTLRERALFLAMERPKRTDADELAKLMDETVFLIRQATTARDLVDRWQEVSNYLHAACREDMRMIGGES